MYCFNYKEAKPVIMYSVFPDERHSLDTRNHRLRSSKSVLGKSLYLCHYKMLNLPLDRTNTERCTMVIDTLDRS